MISKYYIYIYLSGLKNAHSLMFFYENPMEPHEGLKGTLVCPTNLVGKTVVERTKNTTHGTEDSKTW